MTGDRNEAALRPTNPERSVWRGKDGRRLLAVPKRVRGAMGDGDRVQVTIEFAAL